MERIEFGRGRFTAPTLRLNSLDRFDECPEDDGGGEHQAEDRARQTGRFGDELVELLELEGLVDNGHGDDDRREQCEPIAVHFQRLEERSPGECEREGVDHAPAPAGSLDSSSAGLSGLSRPMASRMMSRLSTPASAQYSVPSSFMRPMDVSYRRWSEPRGRDASGAMGPLRPMAAPCWRSKCLWT